MYHFSFVKICQKSCSKSTSHSLTHLHTHLPGAPRLPADSSLFVWDTLLYPGQRSNIMHPVTHLDDKRGGSAQPSAAAAAGVLSLCATCKSCIIRLRKNIFLWTGTQESFDMTLLTCRLSQAAASMRISSAD